MSVTVGLPERDATLRSIFLVNGVNTLSATAEKLSLLDGLATISLTDNPERYFAHQDRRSAISQYLLGARVLPDEEPRYIAELISNNATSRTIKAGVYLIVETPIRLLEDQHGAHRDFRDFSCRLSNASPAAKSNHYEIAHSFLISIQMALSNNFDARLSELDTSTFYQEEDGSYCYCLYMRFGNLDTCISQPLNDDILNITQKYNSDILAKSKYRNIATLLVQSKFHRSGEIQTFVLAWAAFELLLKSNTPNGIENLKDKFSFIAKSVDGDDDDIQRFEAMYKLRNNLFHEGSRPPDLPTDELYRFSIKYLRLLLEYQQT